MYKYKLTYDELSDQYSILRNSDNTQFLQESIDSDNIDYQQFLQDVKKEGLGIVEGPTVGVTTAYNISRQAEYPSIVDQLDKIYHDGVDAWKTDIKIIKDKYPKSQVGITTVAAVPDWVQTEVNVLIKNDYLQAVERLKIPRVALGEKVLIADNYWDPERMKVIENKKYVYQNVPATDDPAVVSDEAERNASQATIDKTPQSIIDSINT